MKQFTSTSINNSAAAAAGADGSRPSTTGLDRLCA
jgi:hypothetical protein